MSNREESLIGMIQDKPWALHPAKLDEIQTFIDTRLNNPNATIDVVVGKSGNRASDNYEIRDGVAVIPVFGVIEKRANMFSRMSGGTSTQLLKRDLQAAMNDPYVESILLDVDSPGGSVDGTKAVADFIFENRGKKPLLAFANGMMASAAYWIGSAAGEIMAEDTAAVGSIGVALTHVDRSEYDQKLGIRRTQIFAGKYKRIASDERPLTEEGQAYLQGIVDTYYGIFVDAVARNRSASVEQVLTDMADGKEFIGRQALDAGLVDSIGNFDQALARAREKGRRMDAKAIKEQYPEGYQEILELGMRSVDVETIRAGAKEDGIGQERSRVLEILDADGDPAVTRDAIQDGRSPDSTKAAFFHAEKQKRTEALKSFSENSPESAGHGAQPKQQAESGFMALVDAYQAEKQCSRTDALKAMVAKYPEIYSAWMDSRASGTA